MAEDQEQCGCKSKMFSNSKVEVLESKLNIYEELSKEMLLKLESAVEKISEGNNNIAQILTKHDERIEQSMKTDTLIINMVEELKKTIDKDKQSMHERIDEVQKETKSLSKFRWKADGVLLLALLIIGVGSRIAPIFLTPAPQQVIMENQK